MRPKPSILGSPSGGVLAAVIVLAASAPAPALASVERAETSSLAAAEQTTAEQTATEENVEEVKVKVDGFGFFKDRELKRTLDLLLGDSDTPATVDAGYIEDASLVLNSDLVERGFFLAAVRAVWTDIDGGQGEAVLDALLSNPLPRGLRVRELRLEAVPGVRAVVRTVEFEGLAELEPSVATKFFIPKTGLYTPDSARAWSPARVRRAATQLRDVLRARGFSEATVTVDDASPDPVSGTVALRVRVNEGRRWRVVDWRVEGEGAAEWLGGEPSGLVGAPWSRALAQDAAQNTRRKYFERGYADVRVSWRAEAAGAAAGASSEVSERPVTAVATVEPGPAWTIGDMRFEGAEKTRPATLATRVRELEPSTPFDPTRIDAARLRLARLGVFRRVEAGGEVPPDGGPREILFRVIEEARWQASWLIGYGSYEQLRGAIEVSRTNLWGLAHRDRVEVGQSFKASRAEYRYSVPTLFNDTVEGSARVFGLRREEPSFTRLEYGAGAEGAREVSWIDARATAGVTYQVLKAEDVALGVLGGELDDTTVAAINVGLSRDVRDNPIRPRSGHRWSTQLESALPELGGETRYERVEVAWSWHQALGDGDVRWVHLGLSHGFIAGEGERIPVNKLFFPGGESSIRGYGEGEATQRDANGRYVGARTQWLVNLEFEQVITGRWTLVVFSDTLGTAADLANWPGDEVLSAVGLGLRYQSPIGPLRMEYGRNLNPREKDPSGTLHFSIGFPF